jgi:hypothetical protein
MLAALDITGCADSGSGVAAPARSAAAPIPAAQAKVFVPISSAEGRTEHGTCWTSSITVRTADAYRCFAGNEILDPCFAQSRTAHVVVCYADPWSPGVRVIVPTVLPAPAPLAVSHPWALELANGKHCVAATGVVNRIGTLALLYQCRHGGSAGPLVTHDGRSEVQYVPAGASAAVPVAVRVIWQA